MSDDLLNFDENTSNRDQVDQLLDQLQPQESSGSGSHSSNNGLTSEYFVVDDKQGNNGNDLAGNIETAFGSLKDKVFAEADSSTHYDRHEAEHHQPSAPSAPSSSSTTSSSSKTSSAVDNKSSGSSSSKSEASNKKSSKSDCAICPYYALGCHYMSQIVVPPKVKDLLLWKDIKYTGIIFGTSFTLLMSFALFSLLTVVGSLMLLALSGFGAYRFYLGLMFRIKGTQDQTFEKLASLDLSLPKDKVKELAHLLETDLNQVANKIKSIVLWDNIYASSIAFVAFYFIYCVGSVFNTLTLLILALVSLFTLPKVYQTYKVQIDAVLEKATTTIHLGVKEAMKKIPFLNKQKTQ